MRKIEIAELFDLARDAFSSGAFRTAEMHSEAVAKLLSHRDLIRRQATAVAVRNSIIVVSYRHSDGFLDMLRSLKAYAEQPGYEVVLVDNGNAHLDAVVDHVGIDCTIACPAFNYGCSGGRNIGARYARGESIVFVDDDGVLGEKAIDTLVETRARYGAAAVRGRVVPLTNPKLTADHYDKGKHLVPALPDAEGLSIWLKSAFLEFGGFDPLLYGHEGLCLTGKMFRFYGPRYFLYAPNAVLHHDFHAGDDKLEEKTKRYDANRSYLDHKGIRWRDLIRTFGEARTQREVRASFTAAAKHWTVGAINQNAPVSIMTTARDGRAFIEDFTRSLRGQTHQNFELVFVDDGSADGTAEAIRELWGNDGRLRVLACDGLGRGAALTTALMAATHDICAIADLDDVSVPHRLEWTARYFAEHPESSCAAFYCFNETTPVRMSRPFGVEATSIKVRSLISMPVAFPSFAFRKSCFDQPFDASLEAGIDCEWLYRNLMTLNRDGHVIQIPAVYYRVHEGQITTTKRDVQREQCLKCVGELHGMLWGGEQEPDPQALALLSGWVPIEHGAQLTTVLNYVYALMEIVDRYPGCAPQDARRHLHDAFLDLQERRMRVDYKKLKDNHERLLGRSDAASPSVAPQPQFRTDYGPLALRKLYWPIGYLAVATLGNKKDRQKFRASPAAFFDSLKNHKQRMLGLKFFPKGSSLTPAE